MSTWISSRSPAFRHCWMVSAPWTPTDFGAAAGLAWFTALSMPSVTKPSSDMDMTATTFDIACSFRGMETAFRGSHEAVLPFRYSSAGDRRDHREADVGRRVRHHRRLEPATPEEPAERDAAKGVQEHDVGDDDGVERSDRR